MDVVKNAMLNIILVKIKVAEYFSDLNRSNKVIKTYYYQLRTTYLNYLNYVRFYLSVPRKDNIGYGLFMIKLECDRIYNNMDRDSKIDSFLSNIELLKIDYTKFIVFEINAINIIFKNNLNEIRYNEPNDYNN